MEEKNNQEINNQEKNEISKVQTSVQTPSVKINDVECSNEPNDVNYSQNHVIENITEVTTKNKIFPQKLHKFDGYVEKRKEVSQVMKKRYFDIESDKSDSISNEEKNEIKKSKVTNKISILKFLLYVCFLFISIRLVFFGEILKKNNITCDVFYLVIVLFVLILFDKIFIYFREYSCLCLSCLYFFLLFKCKYDGAFEKAIPGHLVCMISILFFLLLLD